MVLRAGRLVGGGKSFPVQHTNYRRRLLQNEWLFIWSIFISCSSHYGCSSSRRYSLQRYVPAKHHPEADFQMEGSWLLKCQGYLNPLVDLIHLIALVSVPREMCKSHFLEVPPGLRFASGLSADARMSRQMRGSKP